MALTFTIIAFAASRVLGASAALPTRRRGASAHDPGRLAFAVTFASPSSSWRCSPRCSRRCQRGGAWLNSVKVVMGSWNWPPLSSSSYRELVISAAPAISLRPVWAFVVALCLCAVLSARPLPVAARQPRGNLSVPACCQLPLPGSGLYCCRPVHQACRGRTTATGRGRVRLGEFVLVAGSATRQGRVWTATWRMPRPGAGVSQSTGKTKLVFIDFTGQLHQCNLNENDVFRPLEIQQLFKPYVLVKLYTDPSRSVLRAGVGGRSCKTAAAGTDARQP